MARRILMLVLAMSSLGLAGCDQGRYPISGETCGPRDPVKTLHANDCNILPGT